MMVGVLVPPKRRRDFDLVVNEFGTTGPQRGTDTGDDVAGAAVETLHHRLDRAAEDVSNTSPPAAMHIGGSLPNRIEQKYGLAVGDLDDKVPLRLIRHQGVSRQWFDGSRPGPCIPLIHDCDIDAMHLPGENQLAGLHVAGDKAPV